jgi:acyl-CoA synthetase (AMP-forming)/AMP-acid ligase II
VRTSLHTGAVLARAGVLRVQRPDTLLRMGLTMLRWGPTPAAGYHISALSTPDRPAIHDDRGTVTFAELDLATNALAHGLRELGMGEGDAIAIFCRDHRGFVFSSVAASKLGASLLLLNTSFAGRQIAQVCEAENPRVVIYDEEFADLCAAAAQGRISVIAWQDSASPRNPRRPPTAAEEVPQGSPDPAHPTIDQLIASSSTARLRPPADRGRVVILTSGTTGTPKGASRHQPRSLDPAAALFSRLPLRARETTLIAAPLFHSWGYAHYTLGLALSSTLVLARRFDPEATLAAVDRRRPSALVGVPVMLTRILELGPETIARYDTSSLRVIAVSGSALPGDLALRVMDTFGDVLYNLYGSTEVAWATIASPEQLRAAPGTAGTPPRGTRVALFDEEDREVSGVGRHGRIFVGNEMVMDGYTSGDGKTMLEGLIATGDVGYLDTQGRLFVAGRDDDMIISGGENVFPREVEDLLAEHPAIDDVAVIGVPDEQFGERLRAFVVLRVGATLGEQEVKDYVRDNLARFKVPRAVSFVDVLPRNATGKVLKRDLRMR